MQKKKNTSKIISGIEFLKPICFSIIFSIIILCFFRLTVVKGQSMEPTLYENQKLLLNITAYVFSEPERGDIIIATPANLDIEIIKRVIAVPGDTVEIRDNNIYINGELIEEPYLTEPMVTANIAPLKLAYNEYFVCGDNRNNSLDSRSPIIGSIKEDEIFGKIIINFSSFTIY